MDAVERKVDFPDGRGGTVSLAEPVLRYPDNPILTADQVNEVWTAPHRRVTTVHNAGVAVAGNGTVMLFRSHLRCGISVIGLARSHDGVSGWRVHPVVLFPERFGDRYAGLFRPNDALPGDTGGIFRQIRLGYAPDFRIGPWQIEDQPVMRTSGGPSAYSDKIGPGAPPVRTRHGWLDVFHGVRTTMDGNPYVLGVALHDLDDPRRVRVSSIPVLFPSRADCRVADTGYVHVPNVVFSCGIVRRADGSVLVYYGGNDTVMNVAVTHEDVLADLCVRYGQDPLTGRLRYAI